MATSAQSPWPLCRRALGGGGDVGVGAPGGGLPPLPRAWLRRAARDGSLETPTCDRTAPWHAIRLQSVATEGGCSLGGRWAGVGGLNSEWQLASRQLPPGALSPSCWTSKLAGRRDPTGRYVQFGCHAIAIQLRGTFFEFFFCMSVPHEFSI